MKKTIVIAAFAAVICTSIALAAEQSPSAKSDSGPNQSTSASTAKGSLSAKDTEFVQMAAVGGMKEVQMGQMAEKQGQSAEVKELGRRIAQDHKQANQMLRGIVKQKNAKVSMEKKMEEGKIDPANFDKEFLSMMMADHEKTISAFEAEMKNGDDADLKGFARNTLPTLKEHLAAVKKAQAKMK